MTPQDQALLASGTPWWQLPPHLWQYAGAPLAAQRFAGYADQGGDYDIGPPGIRHSDYTAWLNANLGGDAANFGQPGYEAGSAWVRGANRVTPQQAGQGSAYWGANLNDNTRYYGSQRNAGNVAFGLNNPVTSGALLNEATKRDSPLLNQQSPAASPTQNAYAGAGAWGQPKKPNYGQLGGY